MEQRTIAFIGGGNMARSLISGLLNAGHPAERIHVTDLDQDKLAALSDEFGIQTSTDNAAAARAAEVLVLAVKPQFMAEMLEALTRELGSDGGKLGLAIAAGSRIARLGSRLA